MNSIFETIDYTGIRTAIKDLSNTCKSFTHISTTNIANTFVKAFKNLPSDVELSKSLVSNLAPLQRNL